jgi:hypothetical protein
MKMAHRTIGQRVNERDKNQRVGKIQRISNSVGCIFNADKWFSKLAP